MSIMRCMDCDRTVDTDAEEMVIEETKYGDHIICQSCAEKAEAQRDALDAAASLAEDKALSIEREILPRATE